MSSRFFITPRTWLALGLAGLTLGATLGARSVPYARPQVHQRFPWTTPMRSDTNRPAPLAHGRRLTIVMAMASWCHFCGYEDRWVWPTIIHMPGVAIDLVDVSPAGGMANPGPKTPPFSGTDGSGKPTTVLGMEAAMRQYVHAYHLPPSIHVYVAPTSVQRSWRVDAFPTIWFVGPSGFVQSLRQGAWTLPQAETAVRQALHAAH